MRLRIPLALTRRTTGVLVTSALLTTAGFAQTTSPTDDMTRHPATMSQEECEQLTGGDRTDCERRAQEMTSENRAKGTGAEASGTDPASASTPHQRETDQTSTERRRVSQGDKTSTDADIGRTDPSSASTPHQRQTSEEVGDTETEDTKSERTRVSQGETTAAPEADIDRTDPASASSPHQRAGTADDLSDDEQSSDSMEAGEKRSERTRLSQGPDTGSTTSDSDAEEMTTEDMNDEEEEE